VERILLESPLVQAYRNVQAMMQKIFLHTHLSIKHTDPNMTKTFQGLITRLETHSPHAITVGRKSRHEIVDLVDKGRELMHKATRGEGEGEDQAESDVGDNLVAGMDDVLVELF
jgi:hypothetical protein